MRWVSRAVRKRIRHSQRSLQSGGSFPDVVRSDLTSAPLGDYGWTLSARHPEVDERYNFGSLSDLLIALSAHATIFGAESNDRIATVAERKLLRYGEDRLVCCSCGAVSDGPTERWLRSYRELGRDDEVEFAPYCPECAATEFGKTASLPSTE